MYIIYETLSNWQLQFVILYLIGLSNNVIENITFIQFVNENWYVLEEFSNFSVKLDLM